MSWWRPGVVAWWSVDCLQWTVAAGIAWQWSVRCGTALKDGALWYQHHGTTRLAVDYGGLLSLARATWCGTTSEDDASDFLGLLLWRQWLDARVKQ